MGRFWLVVVLGVVGCGSSEKDATPAAAAGTAGNTSSGGGGNANAAGEGNNGGRDNGGSSSTGTSGSGTSGSGTSGAGTAGGSSGTAWVTTQVSFPEAPRVDLNISQTTEDKVNFTYSLYAKFAIMREQWDGCIKHQLGDCWYYECPTGAYAVGHADEKPQTAGGSVTVESGSIVQTLALTTDHYSGQGSDAFWPLTGGKVYFENRDSKPLFRLEAQSPPTVWLKTLNGETLPLSSLNRSKGAEVTWEAQGEGTAFFSIYTYSGVNVAAVCTWDAAAGSGTLPGAVLEHLDPSDEYYVLLRGDRRVTTTADGFSIEATLYGYGQPYGSRQIFNLY